MVPCFVGSEARGGYEIKQAHGARSVELSGYSTHV